MKKTNREIQKDADDLLKGTLRKLFKEYQFKLGEHQSAEGEEEGIDWFFEVFNRLNRAHEFLFCNQNKGTETPPEEIKQKGHPEIGKFPFQLDLRHAEYFYYQLGQPLIFTLCDIENNKIYWYPIQLDNEIPERIEIARNKGNKSLQIYLDPKNEILYNSFPLFLKDVHNSRGDQIRKQKSSFNFSSDYNLILNKTIGLHIIDKIFETLELFQLPVIPPSVIRKIPTISGNFHNSYLLNSTLHTDNEEFFQFICNIEIVDNKYYVEDSSSIINADKKLKRIIDFFQQNAIHHVEYSGKNKDFRNKRLCIHDLFLNEECNCERCNYDRLNFYNSNHILQSSNVAGSNLERLRKGYTFYLLGDLNNSISEFKKLNKVALKQNNPIIYTITKYNLIHLKRFLELDFSSDNHELIQELSELNFETDEIFVAQYAPFFLDFYNQFKNDAYFDYVFKKVDQVLTEIQKISFSDKYGSRFSNSKVNEIQYGFLRALCFIEFNYVVFNNFHEYQVLANKVLEGYVALHAIKNKDSSHYKEFDLLIMRMWLFHADLKQTNHILHRYNLRSISLKNNNEFFKEYQLYLDNLFVSVDYILNSIKKKNYIFINKVERICWNFTLIFSRINLGDKLLNQLIGKVLDFLEVLNIRSFLNDEAIYQLVAFQEGITAENLLRIMKILDQHNMQYSSAYSAVIDNIVLHHNEKKTIGLVKERIGLKDFSKEELFKSEDDAKFISLVFASLNIDNQIRIKNIINDELVSNFNPDFFYIFTIYDVIDFQEGLFRKFVKEVPDDTKKNEAMKNLFLNSWLYNFRLGQVLNLIFHHNIPITDDLRQLSSLSNTKLYYDWLFNLDDFDYSNFDIYWLLNYKTASYYKAFKRSKKLMKVIEKSMKDDYIEGVAKVYFKIINE